jgi:hypothetical protein
MAEKRLDHPSSEASWNARNPKLLQYCSSVNNPEGILKKGGRRKREGGQTRRIRRRGDTRTENRQPATEKLKTEKLKN